MALLAKNVNSGTSYEGYTIMLGAALDLSAHNWTPIGKDDSNPFKGTFDGNNANYTISNVTVNSGNYVGLFGSVGEGGTVKNVTLKNVNITGSSEIGGIVGWNGGTVTDCSVSGKVTGTNNVGGIVGYQYGGTVSGNTVFSTVSGNNYVGGLVGTNTSGGTVSGNKYYTNQTKEVGLNSTNNGVTNNTRYYSITVLEGFTFTFTGGYTITDGTNTYYASGTVTLTHKSTEAQLPDGYAFSTGNPFTITENTTVTCIPNPANHYVFGTEGNYTLATADNVATAGYPELKQVYALTLSDGVTVTGDTVATDSNGNYYAAGEVTLAAKAGYKISDTSLNVTEDKTITATDVWSVSGGADGSANNPYLISDVAGLQALADYVNGGGNTSNLNFKLAGNIDLKDVSNFTPIGTISNQFKGTFDGGKTYDAQGNCTETYTISNLTINSKDDNVGLFGYVGEGGTIKNVKLTDVDVTGGNWGTDALIGYSYATFENCSVIGGKVTGENGVGGLIGNNDYTVTGCTVDNVSVSATSNEGYADVGGLAGYNDGTVSGNIVIVSNISHQRDNDYVGGLVGFNDEGTVSDNKYCSTFAAVGENEYGTEKNNTRYYKLTLPDGVEVSGDNIFTFGGTTYAAGTVTLATKLGVVYSTENSFTITEDTTITVTDHWNALNGADGSKDKPYLISDVAGLQYLAEYVNGGGNTSNLNFKLNGNIDLTDVDFAPIGYYTDANNNNSFKGTFDGNNSAGYKISNLTVNTPDNNFVGLFGCVGTGGTIQNITLTDVNITGKNNVGGLLGDNEGEVTNCTVSGTVGGNSYVGGLVGLNAFGGRVENNTAITTVNGSNSPVGGVAGSNGSVATNNKFYGNQTDALGKDVVTDSKNTRYYKLTVPEDVTASGGNSFTFDGTTYATGTVTLLSAKTGYALNETSIDVAEDTDLSTTTFTATDVWGVESGANGSTANPYLISDVAGLQLLADYVNAGNTCAGLNFKLTADIDMSSVANFTAIGNFTNKNNYNPFSGTFDGGDFKISNLKINSTLHYNGLFSYVGKDGTVKNVTLDNVDISGNGSLGALVGQNDGTIENCTVSGKVNGKGQFVGGLVGDNRGTVSGGTVNNVEVNSSYRIVGGLVGVNNGGTITDGTVNGGKVTSNGNNVGGLVGYNAGTVTGGTVNNVEVSGYRWVGGLTGYNTSGTVTGSKVVATVTATFTATETVYSFVGGVVGQNANNGTVGTAQAPNYYHSDKGAVDGKDADNNLPIYELTLPDGVTASGALLTYGNKAYVTAGNVTFTGVKTGYVLDNTSVTVSSDMSIGATVDTSDNKHYVFKDGETYTLATNENVAAAGYPDLTQVYELTLPEGVTASGDTVATADGKTYAAGSVTFTGAKTGYVIDGVNVTQDTTVTAKVDAANHYVLADDTKTLATAENVGSYPDLVQVYELTLPSGVTASGDTVITIDGTTYATGNVTFAGVKTGYVINDVNVTQDTSISATFDTANHYVLADNTSTLATAENTTAYPELIQVYELILPSGVTASGDTVATADGKTYAAGNVTFTGVKTGYVINGVNVTEDTTITAILDTANHYVLADNTSTLATAENVGSYPNLVQVYELILPSGVTASGDTVANADGKTYAVGNVTFTGVKTGYVLDNTSVTVSSDMSISATVDAANHYVLADDTKTLATADNTTDYPNLVQVYELTVPDSLKVTGDTVATANGKTYAAGSVTFTAAAGYAIQSITVNGESLDDNTFTVSADATVLADSLKFNKAGTAVEVGGTTGDFSAESGVYSITASQENSTVVGNTNNNNVIIAGGGENILTGGGGNDTYKFESGGGIVTDFGIGVTKDGAGKTLSAPSGSDVIKVDGEVKGVYFDRNASSKKSAKFTAVITYDSDDVQGDDTQIIVLQNINKKPTKYGSNPVYQTNDVAAATLKIWDISGTKQAVLSATKLKKLFHDDSELSELSQTVQTQLVKLNGIGDLNLPAVDQLNQTAQATFNGDDNG